MLYVTYPQSLLHLGYVWTVATGASLPSASGKDLHAAGQWVEVKLLPQEPLKTLCAFPCVTSASLPQRPCHLLCTCMCACLCLHMFMLVCMWCVCMFTNVCACVCLHMFMPVCVYSHVRVLHGVCACAHHSVCAEGRGQPSSITYPLSPLTLFFETVSY